MENTITLRCTKCGTEFKKPLKEYNRQLKKGRDHFFCSRSCCISFSHSKGIYEDKKSNLIPYQGKRAKDELTPFRYFVLRAKNNEKKSPRKVCTITPEYLKELFASQDGICPFSGWKIILPDNTHRGWDRGSNPSNASLDRIDNSKGYIPGNVRFVSRIANLARQVFTDEQLVDFCHAVSNQPKHRIGQ